MKPASFGDEGFIRPDTPFTYQIRFENKPEATGPAALVEISDTLDTDLDVDTFEFTEITFADQRINVPSGLSHYETIVPITANGVNIFVEVRAFLDRDTRRLTLTLRAVDPNTGWLPEDPLVGLLYPNDATGRGEGSVSYRVRPLAGLPTGTVIDNQARIVFDFNDPIDTPLVFNTLDAAAPTSQVIALPATSTTTTFLVQWAGQDDKGGSGIAAYDLYVATDGGPFVPWILGTTLTEANFVGEPGRRYAFYSIARDNVGLVELPPGAADAVIVVEGSTPAGQPPVLAPIGSHTVSEGSLLTFTAAATDPDPDPGDVLTFSLVGAPAGAAIHPSTGVFTWTPTEAQGPGSYTFTVRVSDGGSPPLFDEEQITVTVSEVNDPPVLAPIGDRTGVVGGLLTFTVSATDPDIPANALTFRLDAGAPAGALIDPATGVLFTFTPAGAGTFTVTVRVTDDGSPALSDSETITLTVAHTPRPARSTC